MTHAESSEQQQLAAQLPQAPVAMGEHWEATGPQVPPELVELVVPPELVVPVVPPELVDPIPPPAPPLASPVAVDTQTSDTQVRSPLQVSFKKHEQFSSPRSQSIPLLPQLALMATAEPNASASRPLVHTPHFKRGFIASSPSIDDRVSSYFTKAQHFVKTGGQGAPAWVAWGA
jgi:hypothetical protein